MNNLKKKKMKTYIGHKIYQQTCHNRNQNVQMTIFTIMKMLF